MPTLKLVIALAALIAGASARAEINVIGRGPVYADAKTVALKAPEGVACSDTAVIVADTGNGRLVSFDFKDGVMTGGTEIKLPQLTYPVRVQLDGKGAIYVLDRKAQRIARLDPKGTFLGWLDPKGMTGVIPTAVKVDAAGNAYVIDAAGSQLLVLDPSGTVTRKLPLPGDGKIFTDLAVDGVGTLYVVEAVGATVWSVSKGGAELKPLSKSMKSMMSFPGYITTDGKGSLIVADQNGNGLVILGIDGSYLGRRLAIGWGEGSVYYPSQLCISSGGELVLADRGNNRVQQFTVTR